MGHCNKYTINTLFIIYYKSTIDYAVYLHFTMSLNPYQVDIHIIIHSNSNNMLFKLMF